MKIFAVVVTVFLAFGLHGWVIINSIETNTREVIRLQEQVARLKLKTEDLSQHILATRLIVSAGMKIINEKFDYIADTATKSMEQQQQIVTELNDMLERIKRIEKKLCIK